MKSLIKTLLREGLLTESKFEYQVRDIGGSDVYYKRKVGGDIWDFVDKGDEYIKQNPKIDVWEMVYSLER
jgi:hypothetical protein